MRGGAWRDLSEPDSDENRAGRKGTAREHLELMSTLCCVACSFERVIIHSIPLEEIPHLVQVVGVAGVELLLNHDALSVVVRATDALLNHESAEDLTERLVAITEGA